MKFLRGTFYLLAAFCIFCFAYYRIWFLRQPERNIPHNNTQFISPANGKIVCINAWRNDSMQVTKGGMGLINVWTKDVDTAGIIISIQMDPADVHFQRAPLDAKLIWKKHTKGEFHNAIVMSNDYGIRFENEHNEMLFETGSKRYKVIQIAGFLARRIEDYLKPDQEVKQGDVIGLIKLGSQVTIILPSGVNVKAKTGDIVTDGETVLADVNF